MRPLFDILRFPETLDENDLRILASFGVRAAILAQPAAADAVPVAGRELTRLRQAGITAFLSYSASSGILPGAALETELQRLPRLLSQPRAVALGPLRLQLGDPSAEYACERMLAQAVELRRPAIVRGEASRSPREIRRTLALVRASRIPPEKVLGLSLPAAGLPLFRESGHAVGIGLSRAMPGRRLVETVQRLGSERLLLVGEGADFLSLPKAASLLEEARLPAAVLRRVCFENARRFFGIAET
jgi:predicted metal-dependent TIM-barrel fold hydrolase